MIRQAPNVKVKHKDDGTAEATVVLYALALMATREDSKGLAIHQEASWTYAPSDKEAHDEGMRQAQEKWPGNERWKVQTAIRKVTIVLDLLKKETE